MTDAKVLAAQQWANSTYGAVPGYARCPEDGQTGWSTMYALTMGLQHELGIAPVSASFGPTTLAKLAERPDISLIEPNLNIKKIVQHALFCKGYWGGDGTGDLWMTGTVESVRKLKEHAGIDATNGAVPPKVFKALLSMDAYVTVSGGTDRVRTVQRWLNSRYYSRSSFFIGPADGVYSRDVQKSLMKGIQYELGIPDDQATGSFGPGTQAGLKAHNVKEGDSGVFVELFSGACALNSPIVKEKANVEVSFRSTFDSELKDWVEEFQHFSELEQRDGVGDYATWAQLLVSTGDPNRKTEACDTRFTITRARADALFKAGYRIVGRYLYDPPGSTLDKEIKSGELQDAFAAGLSVFPIYQDNARRLQDFTYQQGFAHALNAHSCAQGYGFNRDTVIYFAVDYDATGEEIASGIVPYFEGVRAGLASKGKKYVHGVYGSRNVCTQVSKHTDARYSFVSGMSWGFSGNLGFPLPPNWAFNQIKEFRFTAGSDVFDLDSDAHRWHTDAGQNSVHQDVNPAIEFVRYLEWLYPLAVRYEKGDPTELTLEYARKDAYKGAKWGVLIGNVPGEFVDFVAGNGTPQTLPEFKDPVTGYALDKQHLMAVANGHYLKPQLGDLAMTNVGDVVGWGGDLITFYAEWRRDVAAYPSGYVYCKEKLGRIGAASTFGFNDLLCDVDGYLFARRMEDGRRPLLTVVREHYDLGESQMRALTRFRDFYEMRFASNRETAAAAAKDVLTSVADLTVAAGRVTLITDIAGFSATQPILLSLDRLTEFCLGFADALAERAAQEANGPTGM
ncbi:glycoside hydrolase domain-containing protein [Streptomyces sp. NBC_00454]|uniref:glycoside hydrolase domain-containing protein n=1 Tax=Streptomyces sp. NBC_00454 TaxID=2975747 RepID=UPI002F913C58